MDCVKAGVSPVGGRGLLLIFFNMARNEVLNIGECIQEVSRRVLDSVQSIKVNGSFYTLLRGLLVVQIRLTVSFW